MCTEDIDGPTEGIVPIFVSMTKARLKALDADLDLKD